MSSLFWSLSLLNILMLFSEIARARGGPWWTFWIWTLWIWTFWIWTLCLSVGRLMIHLVTS